MKRILALCLVLLLTASLIPASVFAADLSDPIWELDTLLSLGAVAPDYDAAQQRYEISTPEQLLYLSGHWKTGDANGDGAPDAPPDGFYVLTADLDMAPLLAKIGTGYMPPIGADVKDVLPGEKSPFFGTFDGQGHVISNLKIVKTDKKYCGMFGNVGYDGAEGFVRNLALVNARVEALATAGLLAGCVYGDVENVFVEGTVDCLEKGAGGLAGKIKKNDNGYLGTARNCFAYADIVIHGEGEENGAAGLITSASSNGGRVYDCYAGGSITVLGEKAQDVGGITGNLKSGRALDNCVSVAKSILTEDGSSIGALCGSYAGENGSHLHNNYVWNGTRVEGTLSLDRPAAAVFSYIDSARALSRSFFTEGPGWDIGGTWTWNGADDCGYPTPAVFGDKLGYLTGRIAADLSYEGTVVSPGEELPTVAYAGDGCQLNFLCAGVPVDSAELCYGTAKNKEGLKKTAPVSVNGNVLSLEFPESGNIGTYYYYLKYSAGGAEGEYPTGGPVRLNIADPDLKLTPSCLTVSPGRTPSEIGLNWTTEEGGLTSSVRYWKEGSDAPSTFTDVVIEKIKVGDDMGSFYSYSADLTGLEPGTAYGYQVFTTDGSKEFSSEEASFTTLPESGKIRFAVISDLQATSEEGYYPYAYTTRDFLSTQELNFVINVGDLTEDNTFAQWDAYYSTLGKILSSTLHTFAPGNHEGKGDPLYSVFKGKTNLPGGIDDPFIGETSSCFSIGDICFVGLNTEPYTGLDGADVQADKMAFYEAQMEYAAQCFKESKARWKILYAHAGLIQEDEEATAFLERACNELGVDLYFNGHIHNYYRATADAEGGHAAVDTATTFVTTSPMGEKFDPYEGEIDDILDFQTGGSDDERQYVTIVEIDGETLTLSAYQRTKGGDSYSNQCKDYTLIDSIVLVNEGRVSYGNNGLLIGIAAGAAVLAAVLFLFLRKKKQAK